MPKRFVQTRPDELSWPLNAEQVENIDKMFKQLYRGVRLGGTGISEYVIGDLLYASAIDTLSTLTSVTAGSYLRSFGLETAPAWSTVKLPNTATAGDLWIASATNTITALLIGTSGKLLRSDGSAPTWSAWVTPASFAQGDTIYASASNTLLALAKDTNSTRYLSNTGTTNNPAWAQVALGTGVSGILLVANGGTGISAPTAGSLIYYNSGTAFTELAIASGVDNAYLRNAGASLPAWSTLALSNAGVQGDIFVCAAANVMSRLAKDTNATRYVSNTGASNQPAWAQVSLTQGVSGDLPYASFVQASGVSVLVGRGSAAGAGDFQEITLGAGLSMAGTVLSGSGTTNALLDGANHTDTIAQTVSRGSLVYGNATPKWDELVIGTANKVLRTDGTDASWAQVALATDVSGDLPFANLAQGSALSVLGVTGNAIADNASIVAGSDHQVFRRSGTAVAFGAVNLAQSAAVTGTLVVGNGGTGVATLTVNRVPYGNDTSAFQSASNFTFDGTTFTTAGQIAFPATQAASAGANTLDDYEEGTWTPVIGGATSESGQTYIIQVGEYLKIGKLVFAQAYVVFNGAAGNKGTITGNLVIKGLPFTAENTTNLLGGAGINYWQSMAVNEVNYVTFIRNNTTQFELYAVPAAVASPAAATTTNVGDASGFIVTGFYRATN